MHAVPIEVLTESEQELVREVIRIEQLQVEALAYDITNFYTHMRRQTRQRSCHSAGTTKQGRDDLRQLGLALVLDQVTQLPLAHALYHGARTHMRSFAEFSNRSSRRVDAGHGSSGEGMAPATAHRR